MGISACHDLLEPIVFPRSSNKIHIVPLTLGKEKREGQWLTWILPAPSHLFSQSFTYRGSCFQSTISSFQFCLFKQPKFLKVSQVRKIAAFWVIRISKSYSLLLYSVGHCHSSHIIFSHMCLINNLCQCKAFVCLFVFGTKMPSIDTLRYSPIFFFSFIFIMLKHSSCFLSKLSVLFLPLVVKFLKTVLNNGVSLSFDIWENAKLTLVH